MICYVCSRTPQHRIYADQKPVCNMCMVEAVNEEKGDLLVNTIYPMMFSHNQQIDAITELMRKLDDIKKGKLKYGLSDLSDWLDSDLEKVCVMLDELRIDTEVE